ncbi:MAG TPA: hypothetical protein VK689_10370, partial [Armatimonadota bacterium]|nr:hypothetical protein [Armatimonadota bacterium]
EVRIGIQDHGLPFGPLRVRSVEASEAGDDASEGLPLIRRAVDRAEWIHRGKQGKELRLVKLRPQKDVTEQSTEAQLAPLAEDEPRAPEQEYTITRLRPEHAVGVSRCIYRVYGNTYLLEDCYYPDRIVARNESGEFVSVVALDEAGEVVGHYALERPRLTRVAERGIAVVSPAHRGRDLMGRMRTFLEEEARRLGLIGVFSYAVTQHVYSQRVNEEFGSEVCGIGLGGGPGNPLFKKGECTPRPQRESYVLYFTYAERPERAVVHAPPQHREVLERIYAGLGVEIEHRPPAPAEGEGDVEVRYDHSLDTGIIRVLRVGEDTAAEIRRARRDLCAITGAEAVLLELPLAQPGAPELCREAEEDGFFFSGLGPSFAEDGDALMLQFLAADLDVSRLKLASPFARELLEYIDSERARVAALQEAPASE